MYMYTYIYIYIERDTLHIYHIHSDKCMCTHYHTYTYTDREMYVYVCTYSDLSDFAVLVLRIPSPYATRRGEGLELEPLQLESFWETPSWTPKSMENNGLLGYFWWFWAILLHTLGVQVVPGAHRLRALAFSTRLRVTVYGSRSSL